MKKPKYIQIDSDILGDSKIAVLVRQYGAEGLGIYLYLLIQMNHTPEDGIALDEIFYKTMSIMFSVDRHDLDEIMGLIIDMLLIYEDDGLYFSKGYLVRTGSYKESNRLRSETQKENHRQKARDSAKQKSENQAKPKQSVKPPPKQKDPEPEPSPEIIKLRERIDSIFADNPGAKNANTDLTPKQIQIEIDRFGFKKLMIMHRIYFGWKCSLAEKRKHTDHGSIMRGAWIEEKADAEIHQSSQVAPQTEDQWPHAWPMPDGWRQWSQDKRKDYIFQMNAPREVK